MVVQFKTKPTRPHLSEQICADLVAGRIDDPFRWLGPHRIDDTVLVAAFEPGADAAWAVDVATGELAPLDRVDTRGVFVGRLPKPFDYRLRFAADGRQWGGHDPYAFGPVLGEQDIHFLAEGRHHDLHEKLGAHPIRHEEVEGTAFAVWAPNARRVSVVGDFNLWDGRRHPMRRLHGAGLWEIFLPGVGPGARYQFEIVGPDDTVGPLKADPVGFRQEAPPGTASIVAKPLAGDDRRGETIHQRRSDPISIYEVHLGSWRRGDGDRHLSYDELAASLIPYAVDLGFTHLEFMPVSEHPFTGSWGYQPIGMFAPTARFGDREGFARLVAAAHAAGLGVIIDWVPAHFPSDPHGLAQFDGTYLYEYADPKLGFHKDWNTIIYNYERLEVRNFLISNALYWLKTFGVDGLRVDAVAAMLYRDYSRDAGEWLPNVHGGRESLEAVALLRDVNLQIARDCPGRATFAEESTAWPGVTHPVAEGGLGFSFKWNMGWMSDTLSYMATDPVHRRWHHDQLTFGIHYAHSESFVLPLSHDEVVHGKGSLIGKMHGDPWQKFANLRAYFGFMWTHPGKKLLFMGGEFAQHREWSHDRALDWHLIDDPAHAGIRRLVRDLNLLYRELPALHALDCDPAGFSWIDGSDAERSIVSYVRRAPDGRDVAVVCNFTPVVRHGHRLGLPRSGAWRECLNTDAGIYGGGNVGNGGLVDAEGGACDGMPASAVIMLPPLATLVFECVEDRHEASRGG